MNTHIYTFHEDPGHGWLEVPLAEIARLKITPSTFSYRDARNAYLEEDADAALWLEAKKRAGEPYTIRQTLSRSHSFIRNLPAF